MRKLTEGFTLIELLVVIAIIGVLASVVLVSLNSARKKGKDAAVISDVEQARTTIESGWNGKTYTDLVAGASTSAVGPNASLISQLANDAANQNSLPTNANPTGLNISTTASGNVTTYAIYGMLVSTKAPATQMYFCIDSTGRANQSNTQNSGASCP